MAPSPAKEAVDYLRDGPPRRGSGQASRRRRNRRLLRAVSKGISRHPPKEETVEKREDTLRRAQGERNNSFEMDIKPLRLSLSKPRFGENRHPRKGEGAIVKTSSIFVAW
jgi:hypothetical protein